MLPGFMSALPPPPVPPFAVKLPEARCLPPASFAGGHRATWSSPAGPPPFLWKDPAVLPREHAGRSLCLSCRVVLPGDTPRMFEGVPEHLSSFPARSEASPRAFKALFQGTRDSGRNRGVTLEMEVALEEDGERREQPRAFRRDFSESSVPLSLSDA